MALGLIVYSVALADAFETLFFGEGWYLGLLLFIILCIALIRSWKLAGALIIPIIIGLEVEYFDRNDIYGSHIWPIIILIILALFVAMYALWGKDKK